MLIIFPYFLLAVSLALTRNRSNKTLFVGLALLVTVPAVGANYINQKEQWREVAQLVNAKGRPGDVVLLHAGYEMVPFEYYYHGELPRQGVPDTVTQLAETAARYDRAWLILSNDRYVDPEGKVSGWFDSCYNLELTSGFAYITVRLYDVKKQGCLASDVRSGRDSTSLRP